MSGHTKDVIARKGILEAVVAFVQKPYTPLSLARKGVDGKHAND